MHFFIQTTLINQVRTNIYIIRSRVNQNRNNLITKLTVYLNDRCMMICLFVIQCCIDMRNAPTNIPNSLCLLFTIYLSPTTLILWEISPAMIFPQVQHSIGFHPEPVFCSSIRSPCPLLCALNFLGSTVLSLLHVS